MVSAQEGRFPIRVPVLVGRLNARISVSLWTRLLRDRQCILTLVASSFHLYFRSHSLAFCPNKVLFCLY